MPDKNNSQLHKLIETLAGDKIISSEQIKEVLVGIAALLGSYKKETENLNSGTKKMIDRAVNQIDKIHDKLLDDIDVKNKDIQKEFGKVIESVKKLIPNVKDGKDGKDGKDADENKIIDAIFSKIKLPEYKETVLDGPKEIVAKLESLEGPERLQATAIDGLDEMVTTKVLTLMPQGGRGGNRFNAIGGGVTQIKVSGAGITMTSSGSNGRGVVTLTVSGGGGGSSEIVVGETPVTGADDGNIFYNEGGVVGAYTTTGTGHDVVLSDTPTLITPILGVATATSINKVTITAPATSATLTLANGSSLITSGANSITLTSTGATNVTLPTTGTLATLSGVESLANKTLDEPKIINGGFIKDGNGNELIIFTTTTFAVNELTFNNAATGNNPRFLASGGDSNIGIDFTPKGTGTFNIRGNSTQAGELRLYEDTDDGTNFSGFRGSARSGDMVYLMPTADPTSGQALTAGTPSGGTAQLSWTTVSGSMSIGSAVTSGTSGSVLFVDGSSNLAQDNTNFFWDDTNNYLGIGINAPTRTLHIRGDVSNGIATLERTNSSTNAVVGTAIIKGTSSGDMTDGFGVAFQFAIQDTAAVENLIANIRAYRDGADNSGALDFVTYTGGVTGIVAKFSTGGDLTLTPKVRTTGSPTGLLFTAPAHTTLTASTEVTDVNFNLARTVQLATGALTTQRAFRIQGTTYAFVGSSTITSAQTVNIGVPVAGTNATITNNYGLVVGTPSDFINTIANFGGPLNAFYEINMQNTSSGTLASSDVTAASDNSTNATNFVDMGITSSGFTDSAYTAWGGANSAYLFSESASLNFATQRASATMNWFTGGTLTANKRMSLSGTAATLTIGVAGSALGSLALAGNTSGTATIVPTAAAGSVTITLPATTGTVILDAGTQTLTGAKTFSATLTVSGAQIQNIRNSLGTTITAGTIIANTTSAGVGTPQISPYLGFQGTGHNGTASTTALMYLYAKPLGGTSPITASLVIGSNINAAGTNDRFFFTDDGRLYGNALHNNAGAMTGATNQYIGSGTYTPTLTGVANVGASTAYVCQWMRVGNVVTVSGKFDLDPTTTLTLTQLGISLPIASAITASEQCGGTFAANAVNEQGAVIGDATNDRAEANITPTDVANRSYHFTFTYLVL